jgi:glycosyltransferase involved in cell wall biosynthesis
MIVKNESKIITRLFDSIVSIIDHYIICDTGSTDDTVDIIEKYFKDKNITGKVIHKKFKNFGFNRTYALQACKTVECDYILLLDADMVFEVKNFDKNKLSEYDSYMIFQGNDTFYYKNKRIVKNNGMYNYVGVTHEYVNSLGPDRMTDIDKNVLFIRDIGDGGSKADKYERDIRLLSQDIIENPKNDRSFFYLANSYYNNNLFNEAIETYKQRIALGGWVEEVWYSHYNMGQCYMAINKPEHAIQTWLNAFDLYPRRLEAMYEVIKYYRVNAKFRLAYEFYKMCKEILNTNFNRNDYLFLHDDVYTYKIYHEYVMIASFIGIKNVNDELIKIFNYHAKYPNVNQHVLGNMKYYPNILVPTKKVIFDKNITLNINGESIPFTSSSTSIIKNINMRGLENGVAYNDYLLNVRYVNYYINEQGGYLNCDKHIITANMVLSLDSDFKFIDNKIFDVNYVDQRYIGYEDVRIFKDCQTDKLLFMGTGYDNETKKLGIVAGEYDMFSNSLVGNNINVLFHKSDCEKNWVFTEYKKETHVIYNWYPLQICKISESKDLSLVETKQMPYMFSLARGSSCGFKYNNYTTKIIDNNISLLSEEIEIWFIVHLVSYESPRHYYHMLVVFDENMNLKKYSAPFKFEGDCIEYSLGLIVEKERVVISYSTMDRTSRLGIYEKKYIDDLLVYK